MQYQNTIVILHSQKQNNMKELQLRLLETYQEVKNLEIELQKANDIETEVVYITKLTLSLRLDLLLTTILEFKQNN